MGAAPIIDILLFLVVVKVRL